MSWNNKVLDNLDQLYWSPKKLGLQTVRAELTPDGSAYLVPKARLDDGRSLYCRGSTAKEWRETIHQDEELLNQVIEIALAIAPSSFVSEAFFSPLGIRPEGRIKTIGREAGIRHAALAPQQFTQHDGFYVASNAIVMMEMKLKARTSIEQYLKYCTLVALEEITNGKKDEVGLIYLVPQSSVARTRLDLRMDDPDALRDVWSDPAAFTNKSTLKPLLEAHAAHIKDVGDRLRLRIITWDDLLAVAIRCRDHSIANGDETLENLMQGILDQVDATPDCGLAGKG